MARSRVISSTMGRGLPLTSDGLAGSSPSVRRGLPQSSHAQLVSPNSLEPRQQRRKIRLRAWRIGDGEGSLTSSGRSVCVISCDVESGCASGASCAQPCDVLYLVDDSPCVLLWGIGEGTRHESETNRKNSDRAKTQILYGTTRSSQGLDREDSYAIR